MNAKKNNVRKSNKNSRNFSTEKDHRWLKAKDGSSHYYIAPRSFKELMKKVAGKEIEAELRKIGTSTKFHWSKAQNLIIACRKAGVKNDFRFLETEAARKSRYQEKYDKSRKFSKTKKFQVKHATQNLGELINAALNGNGNGNGNGKDEKKSAPVNTGSEKAKQANRELYEKMFATA